MVTVNTSVNPHAASRIGGDEPELMVWITVAAALVIGFFLTFFVTNQTTVASAGGTTLSYPSTWVPATEKGAAFAVADLKGGGAFGDRVSLTKLAKTDLLPGQGTLQGQAGLPEDAGLLRLVAHCLRQSHAVARILRVGCRGLLREFQRGLVIAPGEVR